MNWNPATRRHFLRGAGKAAVILPFLPSLLPEKAARAQAAGRQKSFIGVPLQHGIVNEFSAAAGGPSVYMPAFKNMQQIQPAGRHVINYKTLEAAKNDGGGKVSNIFDAAFNPYLPKMSMLQGLDFFFTPESHHNASFGNTGTGGSNLYTTLPPNQASIDQVMAYSTNFYKNPALLGKSVCWTGNQREYNYFSTFTYANPASKQTSAIDGVNAGSDPQQLWDAYFKNFSAKPPVAMGPTLRQKLADGVLLDYKAFIANPRLGRDDRMRVNRHISLLNDTQKSLSTVMTAGCAAGPARPAVGAGAGYAARKQSLQAMNNVIVSLIACGLCHSFSSHFHSMLDDNPEQWHAWAHAAAPEHTQQTSAVLHDVVLDLVTKLDQNGLLDDSLVMVPQEHSTVSHRSYNLALVTFGGAGGAWKTGQYVDYRNMTGPGDDIGYARFGFPMTQALANILMAMDVPASEFEPLNRESAKTPFNTHFSPSISGYGSSYFQTYVPTYNFPTFYSRFKGANLSEWLPLIKA